MELKLSVVGGPGAGTELDLSERRLIGRSAEADLRLDSTRTSRSHAAVEPGPDGPAIADLGSSNGTLVNGEPLTSHRHLAPGDVIEIGDSRIKVATLDPTTEAIPPPPGPGAEETRAIEPPTDPNGEPTAPTSHLDPGTDETRVLGPGAEEPPTPTMPEPAAGPPVIPAPAPRPGPVHEPAARTPAPVPRPAPYRPPAEPRRPRRAPAPPFNWQAASALALGILSILLVFSTTDDLFYAALPAAIAAIVLGSVGKRRADRRTATALRPAALAGQICGVVGLVLAIVLIAVVLAVNALTDTGLDTLFDLIDETDQELADEVWQQIRDSF